MNPETFPHRKDTAYGMSPDCRCGADDAGAVGIGATWGTDCPAALREALEAAREELDEARSQEEYQRLVNALLCKPTEVAPLSNQDIHDPRVAVRSSLMTMAIKLMAAAVRTNPNAVNYGAWTVAANPDALVHAEPGSPEDIDGWDIHVACVRPGGKGPADLVADVKKERDAALVRVAELERTTPGPHIPPALLRRVEALGFVPGSGEPVGWLLGYVEGLAALLTTAQGERDELAATLVNERAAWVDMREDVLRNEMAPGGTIEINDMLRKIDEYMPDACTEPAPEAIADRSAGGDGL